MMTAGVPSICLVNTDDDDDDDNDEDGDDDGDDDDDDDGRAQHLPGQCSSQTHTTQCHSIAFGVFFSNSTAVTLG